MATSSILGGAPAPAQPSGKDIDALGPSDSTDSGSDVQADLNPSGGPGEDSEGALPVQHDSTTDRAGTGERASADAVPPATDADLLPQQTRDMDGPDAGMVDEMSLDEDAGEEPDAQRP